MANNTPPNILVCPKPIQGYGLWAHTYTVYTPYALPNPDLPYSLHTLPCCCQYQLSAYAQSWAEHDMHCCCLPASLPKACYCCLPHLLLLLPFMLLPAAAAAFHAAPPSLPAAAAAAVCCSALLQVANAPAFPPCLSSPPAYRCLPAQMSAAADFFGFNADEKDAYLGGYVMAAFFLVGAPSAILVRSGSGRVWGQGQMFLEGRGSGRLGGGVRGKVSGAQGRREGSGAKLLRVYGVSHLS